MAHPPDCKRRHAPVRVTERLLCSNVTAIALVDSLSIFYFCYQFSYFFYGNQKGLSVREQRRDDAAEAAASKPDPGLRVVNRYHYAVIHTQRLKEIGKNEMFPLTSCPEEFSLGYR